MKLCKLGMVFLYDFIGFKPDDFETTPVVDSLAQLTSCRDIKSRTVPEFVVLVKYRLEEIKFARSC